MSRSRQASLSSPLGDVRLTDLDGQPPADRIHIVRVASDPPRAYILGPAEKVQAYEREIMDEARRVLGPKISLTAALAILAKNQLPGGKEVPEVVQATALAILHEDAFMRGCTVRETTGGYL